MSPDKSWPIGSPGFYDKWIFPTPFVFKFVQGYLSSIERCCFINALEISNKGFLIFGCNIFNRIANLVNNTMLNLCVRINAFNCFREAFEAVNAGYKNILNISVM